MFRIEFDSKLLADLRGKDLIAFGTGKVGKILIPYLDGDPSIRLYGVTNSRVVDDDAGIFPDTNLPLRSLSAWAKRMPHATILVAVLDMYMHQEILDLCLDAGFQDIVFAKAELVNAIAHFYSTIYPFMKESYIDRCKKLVFPESNPILQLACLANEIHDVHKASFAEFKACHKNRSVTVVATGPSMNYYSPIQGVVHIGVNAAFKREDLKLDYYFLNHYVPEWVNELKKYDFIKFFGYHRGSIAREETSIFPESIVEENHARRYFQNHRGEAIHYNIEYYPLMNFNTIVFPALHFAIYTRPKQIFLVGCDCVGGNHFDGSQGRKQHTSVPIINEWAENYPKVKEFVADYYPDTEIISVNPVGLKGLFRDVYTESYLDAHPEIDRAAVEILNPADYV